MQELSEYCDKLKTCLEQMGFKLWEEPSTDNVRKVCWLFRFPPFELLNNNNPDEPTAPSRLVLSVDYDLCIGDAPDVLTSANFDYCFEGVRLELRDASNDEPLGTLPLNITTPDALKIFVANFPRHPYSGRHH